MNQTFDLLILNQKFTLKSDKDEKHVKKVADYVNKKMHEIVTANKAIATSNVAILAALNIADDLFQMRSKHQELTEGWMEKLKNLMDRIENN